MDAWRPKHVEDYDTIKFLWKWKCIKLVTLLRYIMIHGQQNNKQNLSLSSDDGEDSSLVGCNLRWLINSSRSFEVLKAPIFRVKQPNNNFSSSTDRCHVIPFHIIHTVNKAFNLCEFKYTFFVFLLLSYVKTGPYIRNLKQLTSWNINLYCSPNG
jgi:hypothetical protein